MFNEHDVVRLKHGVAAEGSQGWPGVSAAALETGAVGTGTTFGLLTLTEADIEPGE